jgi:hypothetical protein
MRLVLRVLLASCMLVAASMAGAAAPTDPLIGTWVMDPAKSTFKPGPPMKSQTRVFTSFPDGTQMIVTVVPGEGAAYKGEATYRLDGKDYPLSGVAGIDTISMALAGELKVMGTAKLKGEQVGRFNFTVSPDRKTMTLYFKSLVEERPSENTMVFSRK